MSFCQQTDLSRTEFLMDLLYLVATAVIATDFAPRLPVLKSPVHPHLPTNFVVFPNSRNRPYFKLLSVVFITIQSWLFPVITLLMLMHLYFILLCVITFD